jgi:hypothetical protein
MRRCAIIHHPPRFAAELRSEKIRAEMDALFGVGRDLAEIIEDWAPGGCSAAPDRGACFELLDEFVPTRRFKSASSASSSAILAACAATSEASSSYDGRAGSASGTPELGHTRSPSITTRRGPKLNTYVKITVSVDTVGLKHTARR